MGKIASIANFITRRKNPSDRINGAFGRLATEAGLSPLFAEQSMEARRADLTNTMQNLINLEFSIAKKKTTIAGVTTETVEIHKLQQIENFEAYKLARLFEMFFITGDPWVRGLDNSAISKAVTSFIQLYEEIGHESCFLVTLNACAMQLMHLSWQAIDIDRMPPTLLSSQPLLINQPNVARPKYMTPDGGEGAGETQE